MAGARKRSAHPHSTGNPAPAPLATAAVLDSAVFSKIHALDAIPATWEERARKAWEYYLEEPLVKNCVNSWRSFAVGDEIKVACDVVVRAPRLHYLYFPWRAFMRILKRSLSILAESATRVTRLLGVFIHLTGISVTFRPWARAM